MIDYKDKFIKKLEIKKEGNFTLIGEYKNYNTKTLFKHNVCGYEWKTKPSVLMSAKGLKGCPNCQRLGNSILPKDFPDIFYNKVPKTSFILDTSIPYTGQRNDIAVTCVKCGNRFVTYWGTFCSNQSCPECHKLLPANRKKSPETYKKEILSLYGNEYTLLTEYTRALDNVLVIHNKCGLTFNIRAAHLLAGHGCPNCYSSRGETQIRSILNKLGVKFIEQYKFKECLDKKPLPFDFCVKLNDGDKIVLIEYDGIQHYQPFTYFGGVNKFNNQKNHDNIKNNFCKEKRIPLLRIPYTFKTEEITLLIDKFLNKHS